MIIDMHAHYLPTGFLEATKRGQDWYGWRLFKDASGGAYLAVEERSFPIPSNSDVLEPEKRHAIRKREQDVDMEALIVLAYMWNYHLETKQAIAVCREVNQELADIQKSYPEYYRGLALLPMQDTASAIAEMERAVKDLGLRSFAIGASVNGKNLDDPTLMPVLEAAADANVTLSVHPPMWDRAGEGRFPRYYFANSFGAPLESSLAGMSIIYSGLLDRHPNLKIALSQGGGWVHYGIGRFTLRYHQRQDARPMQRPPEEYLGMMYYDCLVHDAGSLQLLIDRVGADRVMIGTDWPAGGDIPGGAPQWIQKQDFLSEADKLKILYKNAATFLGIEQHVSR